MSNTDRKSSLNLSLWQRDQVYAEGQGSLPHGGELHGAGLSQQSEACRRMAITANLHSTFT